MGWGCVRRGKSERMASNSLTGVRGRREGLSVVAMEVMPCIRNCEGIHEAHVLHIHEEVEMSKEIGT